VWGGGRQQQQQQQHQQHQQQQRGNSTTASSSSSSTSSSGSSRGSNSIKRPSVLVRVVAFMGTDSVAQQPRHADVVACLRQRPGQTHAGMSCMHVLASCHMSVPLRLFLLYMRRW
jgi:transcription initiation factor TFIID subunit TAF12